MLTTPSATPYFKPDGSSDIVRDGSTGLYHRKADITSCLELGIPDLTDVIAIYPNGKLDIWATIPIIDPNTGEEISKVKQSTHASTTHNCSISSASSVSSVSSPIPSSIPSVSSASHPPVPPVINTIANNITTPTIHSTLSPVYSTNYNIPQTPISHPTTPSNASTTSIPNIVSTPSSTPHIAKSFRSPPPSDYFVNNAANLSYVSISQYFKLPLHEACVALRVDESSLKKRCRELGIRRWPYRKRCNIGSGKGAQTQQVEEVSGSGDQLFSCFQLNKGKGSPVVQKMKNEEALALEALGSLQTSGKTTAASTTPTAVTESAQQVSAQQTRNPHVVSHQPPRAVPTTGVATYPYPYPPHPGYPPHMYPPHPGYHYPYGVPPTHDGSQPVPYPMYAHYPPQTAVPPGTYPPPQPTTEAKEGQPQQPAYVPPYYYDYRYPYPPQSGSVPSPYSYPPQPGYSYPPHPEQAYPYPPHGYPPVPYPQMSYPPQPVQVPKTQPTSPLIVSTSPAETQPISTGTPCRTVSSSETPTTPTPVGSPQTKMVYQRETKVLHPVRCKPTSPTETTLEIASKIKRERAEDQEEAAKKVRRDLQISNPLCVKPQAVQNGSISTPIKVADK